MDTAPPVLDSDKKTTGLSAKQNSRHQRHKLKYEGIEIGSAEVRFAGPENVDSEKVIRLAEHDEKVLPKSGKVDMNSGAAKNSSKSARKRKKVSPKLKGRRYLLRSSLDGVRVLRSMSNTKCKTQSESENTSVNPVTKRRKKRRKVKRASIDEFSVIRKRIRYLLTRMNYEQNLIDAYVGEGWKGQSAEKIRPEKELERAKSEILRCKLKIRDLFRHLDSLSSEGRFQESLFDSEGQICSEDIFCAKCGSKDLSADNDIILCDGICDRGFHQKCLNPPLLSEDIPLGDEGWLCPACDCKVDCIDLLNEFQGSDISIEGTWEKVFPEAAAIANGNKQYDDLPSDDSEDDDYNPDGLEVDVEDHKEESDSDESDFTSSEESDASNHEKQNENFGFPSDDSEDDDYNPDDPDPHKSIQKDGSSSDESDFTSDSDDLCAELSKTLGTNEDSASSLPNLKPTLSGEGRCAGGRNNSSLNSEPHSILETDLNQENVVLVSGKRQLERLDYKRLYDGTYGKSSSDSSDDEDWSESSNMSTLKKGKNNGVRKESAVLSKANAQTIKNHRSSRSAVGKLTEVDTERKSDIDQPQVSQVVSEITPEKTHPKLDLSIVNHKVAEQHHGYQEPGSNVNKSSTSVRRRLGRVYSQKLYQCFQENQFPTREKKESLAQEVGLTVRQVDKWFGNTRHSFRVSGKESSQAGVPSPNKDNLTKTGRKSNKPDDGVGQSSAEGKGGKSVPARKSKVGAEHGNEDCDNMKEAVDKDRQKAIARELRKVKQGR